jgi:RUN domain-containing protein 1
LNKNDLQEHENLIEDQRNKQKELIEQLKSQLEDLETYAYQSGGVEIPSNVVLQKQRVIIDELKEKINLPLDNLNKLSNEELKIAVDSAISQVI